MEVYRDWDNDSGIRAYEIGRDYIIVEFKTGRHEFYKYAYSSASSNNVEEMKKLARVGDGLNEFIIEKKLGYKSKW